MLADLPPEGQTSAFDLRLKNPRSAPALRSSLVLKQVTLGQCFSLDSLHTDGRYFEYKVDRVHKVCVRSLGLDRVRLESVQLFRFDRVRLESVQPFRLDRVTPRKRTTA